MRKSFLVLCGLLALVLLFCVSSTVQAQTTIQVPPKGEQLLQILLEKGDRLEASIDATANINSWMTDPQGTTVLNYYSAPEFNIAYNAQTSGEYTLHFNNSFSSTTQTVTVTYNVDRGGALPGGGGIDSPLIVIGIICTSAGVLAIIFVLTRRRKTLEKKKQ